MQETRPFACQIAGCKDSRHSHAPLHLLIRGFHFGRPGSLRQYTHRRTGAAYNEKGRIAPALLCCSGGRRRLAARVSPPSGCVRRFDVAKAVRRVRLGPDCKQGRCYGWVPTPGLSHFAHRPLARISGSLEWAHNDANEAPECSAPRWALTTPTWPWPR
jgi:hypothetical protein